MKLCAVEGCDRTSRFRGMCDMHYRRARKHGDPLAERYASLRKEPQPCSIEGCERVATGRGWCRTHYTRWYKQGDPLLVKQVKGSDLPTVVAPKPPCSVDGCEATSKMRGWCKKHYTRWRRTGHPEGLRRRPKGSGYVTPEGYRMISVDGRRRPEHRVVMEQVLGRPLYPGENVHHINGVRHDNRPESLQLWVTTQPAGQRIEDVLAWAQEIVARYEGPFALPIGYAWAC